MENKFWSICIGLRNTGKGVLVTFLKNAFQCYIGTVNSENFMFKNMSSMDAAKMQSWMIDHEFTRLAISNEITLEDDRSKCLKINGNIIKRFASGKDELCGRKNYQNETYFMVQATLMIMCNDIPPCSPNDAIETLTALTFPRKFVSKEDYDMLSEKAKKVCGVKDDSIKEWSADPEVINAFIWTILDHYSETIPVQPPSISTIVKDLMTENKQGDINDLFEFTWDINDIVPVDDVKKLAKDKNVVYTKLKHVVFPANGVTDGFARINKIKTRVYCGLKITVDTDDIN